MKDILQWSSLEQKKIESRSNPSGLIQKAADREKGMK